MVRAWYMDNDNVSDEYLQHQGDPPKFITLKDLFKTTGVEYFKLNINTLNTDGMLEKIKSEKGYNHEDEVICAEECLPAYENQLKNFHTEHLHTNEEMRLIVEGSGYFDVRDKNDEWIRIEVVPGDLIILPSGIYHRLTLDCNHFIKVRRFFVGEAVWLSYNRPSDNMDCRKKYVEHLKTGNFENSLLNNSVI